MLAGLVFLLRHQRQNNLPEPDPQVIEQLPNVLAYLFVDVPVRELQYLLYLHGLSPRLFECNAFALPLFDVACANSVL